jgi:hypothetical protein
MWLKKEAHGVDDKISEISLTQTNKATFQLI